MGVGGQGGVQGGRGGGTCDLEVEEEEHVIWRSRWSSKEEEEEEQVILNVGGRGGVQG